MLENKTKSYATELDQEIRLIDDENFKNALKHNVSEYYLNLINDIDSGVINVFGAPGLGKTLISHKIAYEYFKRGKGLIVNFDYTNGYNYISKDKVLIVKQGAVERIGKDESDSYGSEQYQSYASKRNGIVILISTKQIMDPSIDFAIEALGYLIDKEVRYTKGLLYKKRMMGFLIFGALQDEEFIETMQYLTDQARAEYHRTELETLVDDLEYSTDKLIKNIFPSKTILETKPVKDKDDNAIHPIKILIHGDVNSGKSTLMKILNALGHKKYIIVWSQRHKNDISLLYHKGFSKEKKYFAQLLFVEDATYNLPETQSAADKHIRVRHLMNEATGGNESDRSLGVTTGLCAITICLHRLTGSAAPTFYRNYFDFQFFLDLPTNKYDRNYVRDLLNSNLNYDFLVWISRQRLVATSEDTENIDLFYSLLGTGVCVTKDEESIPFQLHTKDYETKTIPVLKGSTRWFETWANMAKKVIMLIKEKNWKPTPAIINDLITTIEIEEYGLIRKKSEGGINYREVVSHRIKAHFDKLPKLSKSMTVNANYSNNNNRITINLEDDDDDAKKIILRDLIRNHWLKLDVNIPYSRVLTSYYIWFKDIYISKTQKAVDNPILPNEISIDNFPSGELYLDWKDAGIKTIKTAQSFYSTISSCKKTYERLEHTFGSHDKEAIGEEYAHIILENSVREHLNHTSRLSSVGIGFELKYRDEYIRSGGKSHDLVMLLGGQSFLAVNHKLTTSNKTYGKTDRELNGYFGTSTDHPFRLLWITWTRPFRELYYISCPPHYIPDDIVGGLGAQWIRIDTWKKVIEIIGRGVLEALLLIPDKNNKEKEKEVTNVE